MKRQFPENKKIILTRSSILCVSTEFPRNKRDVNLEESPLRDAARNELTRKEKDKHAYETYFARLTASVTLKTAIVAASRYSGDVIYDQGLFHIIRSLT